MFNRKFLSVNGVTLASLLCVIGLSACSRASSSEIPQVTTNSRDSASLANASAMKYTCSMHPEVISDKPGTCPKCGMELVPVSSETSAPKFKLDFETLPQNLKAGEPAILKFVPKTVSGQTVGEVSIVHEMPMHLMVISKDLTFFDHVHPEHKSDGSFILPYKFPRNGDFVIWAEMTPKGEAAPQRFRMEKNVGGVTEVGAQLSPASTFEQDGYKYVLSIEGGSQLGQSSTLKVAITKHDVPVQNLDNYLGALGHMTILSADTKSFLHAHPEDHDHEGSAHTQSHSNGPNVRFMTLFKNAGLYKVWAQFNIDGKVRTAEFVIKAGEQAG